ncbi:MAG: hypothetical protein WC959_01020 [Kiritimatiellales bacterium]
MMQRRIVFTFILLTAAMCVGWMIYVSPAAKNPYAPLPADARIIYSSNAPDFSVLKQRPSGELLKPVFQILPQVKYSSLILAAAAAPGRNHCDALIFVSAIGSRSTLLRWRMEFFLPDGIRSVHSYGAWPVWEIEIPANEPPGRRIRFSITEGLLICAISDNSHDIYYLLDTLDGRRPSRMQTELSASLAKGK